MKSQKSEMIKLRKASESSSENPIERKETLKRSSAKLKGGERKKKMILPDFSKEEKLYQRGYRHIAGVDEAGRGPLAGPLAAAAVVFSDKKKAAELIKIGIRDSKVLTARKREYLYHLIIEKCEDWSVSFISEEIIDEINILEATKLAMKEAVEKLKIKPDFLLIDGRNVIEDYPASQLAIPKADRDIFSVSAASIIAKVERDRIFLGLDKKYPGYGFARHKGYGTKFHLRMIKKKGPCEIHRKSFGPVRKMIEILKRRNRGKKKLKNALAGFAELV